MLIAISISGNFIYQNYRQALEKIADESQRLTALAQNLGTSDADYERYLQAERDYLVALKTEPKEVQEAIDYIELLQGLAAAACVSQIFSHSLMFILS